jgi:uncharacterized delta-60 repeat protein
LDNTLLTGPNYTNGFDGAISALISLPNDSFLAGGSFFSVQRQIRRGLARIGTNNLSDPLFFSDAGFTGSRVLETVVASLALQSGSNIIAGGAFMTCDSVDRPGLARIQLDGSLDTNFVTADFGPIYAVAVQKDQKIWAGGTNIVRLNADGSTDLTLAWANSTNDSVKALLVQPDDKVLVAGVSLSSHSLIRLNADATVDPSFTPLDLDTNFTDIGVYALELQPDGKIIAGGKFTTANGAPVANIVRLNADGTIDTSFHAELTFAGPAGKAIVKALRLDGADTLLVGGYFDQANGLPRYCAAALETGAGATEILQPTLHLAIDGAILTITFSTQSDVNYTVEAADTIDSANWTPLPNAPHNTGIVQANISTSNQFFRVVARP